MCSDLHHDPGFFPFVPPHIFEAIVRNGTPAQRGRAERGLRFGEALRATRGHSRPAPAQATEAARRPPGEKSRVISTASHGRRLPGSRMRVEHQGGTRDTYVDEMFDGLGAVLDFFWEVYRRDSIDGAGAILEATVHYDSDCQNAIWDGQRVVASDGGDGIVTRFTGALEVIGHEVTHGIIGRTANLDYIGQAGALTESLCDVFGSMVKQYAENPRRPAAQADWLMGAGLLAPGIAGIALRSMMNPGSAYDDALLGADPQPAHMRDYVTTASDDCGVHINSGIPNRAFCLVAISLGGYSWAKAGSIWYRTLLDPRLAHTAQFRDFANLTAESARVLYGKVERRIVVDAWHQVGIVVT
jgi:Zn-dependent metalloprotease